MPNSDDLVVLGDANPDVVLLGAPEVLTFGQAEREVASATLTPGGSGALMAHAAGSVGLVDTIGAGDAFDGGLVTGLSQGLELRGALLLAVAAGTMSVRRVGGADGQPTAAEATLLAECVVVEDEE